MKKTPDARKRMLKITNAILALARCSAALIMRLPYMTL
jgi:hypothetical protein